MGAEFCSILSTVCGVHYTGKAPVLDISHAYDIVLGRGFFFLNTLHQNLAYMITFVIV